MDETSVAHEDQEEEVTQENDPEEEADNAFGSGQEQSSADNAALGNELEQAKDEHGKEADVAASEGYEAKGGEQEPAVEDAPPLNQVGDDVVKDAEDAAMVTIDEPSATQEKENMSTETADRRIEEDRTATDALTDVPTTDTNATATVKFVLLPTGQVATMRCGLSQTLEELKQHFAKELRIPASVIMLLFEGSNTSNHTTLRELGVGPNGTVQLEMQSADPVNTPIKAFRPRQEYIMPDVITVRVLTDSGYKDVVVEIERPNRKKAYLGGYRHRVTGVEFHHASAQTSAKQKPPSNIEKFCRDTQTVQMRHRRQQTSYDSSTQMTKIGVYISNMEDRLVTPGKYTTAEQRQKMILKKVIVLQKYWRRWLAVRRVARLMEDKRKREEWEREEEIRKRKDKEDRFRKEFERRMNPKTKEDFDLLYSALEKWRKEELGKIDATLTGAERKAALCQLMEQETQLIASIGRHKMDANIESKSKSIQSFLEKAAAPKKWKGPDGGQTEMDTPYTIRARELRDIYNSVNMKYLTQDERLDVLLTLKHTVKEHDCKLTQEIVELIDREADLLMRGVKDSNLEGLRQRISTLFLQYIKTPLFNPEASRLLKVPQDPAQLRQNVYHCAGCSRYLPSTEFQLSTNSRTVGRCRECRRLDNDARARQDYSHYRLMLRDLRRTEESYGDDSKVAFLLQENDLRYLVEKIWNGQSVVSAWDDVYDLILVRWNKYEEWSPWNCVLLTKEESTAHERLLAVDEGYGKELVHKVHRKHALARNYFSRLPGMAEHMRKKAEQPTNGPEVLGVKPSVSVK